MFYAYLHHLSKTNVSHLEMFKFKRGANQWSTDGTSIKAFIALKTAVGCVQKTTAKITTGWVDETSAV